MPRRIVQVHRRAKAIFAGVAVATIVGINTARDTLTRNHVNDQIGRSDGRARRQRRGNFHAWNVRQQQQAAFQWRDGNRVAAVEPRQLALNQAVGQCALVANSHLAVLAFDHGNGDHTILDFLGWQVSLRYKIACVAITLGNLILSAMARSSPSDSSLPGVKPVSESSSDSG